MRPGHSDSARFAPFILTTPGRAWLFEQTLRDLYRSEWVPPVCVYQGVDVVQSEGDRVVAGARYVLEHAVGCGAQFIIFLEDDLRFNRYLAHNLRTWLPLQNVAPTDFFVASLYDPGVRALEYCHDDGYFVADPECAYGSQALVLSVPSARDILAHWDEESGFHDFRLFRLGARRCPIHYHIPPLVQHVGSPISASRVIHCVAEFDPYWMRR
jgi:hypothetical protein